LTPIAIASLVLACGGPAWADRTPRAFPVDPIAGSRVVGHIYVNAVTGEKIGSSTPGRGCGLITRPVWLADNTTPCNAVNAPSPYAGDLAMQQDNPAWVGDPDNGDRAYGSTYLHWGDIPADTTVDTVQAMTFADHPDTDADGDGLGDGVEGLGCSWTFYEGDNGFNSCITRLGLIGLTLSNIPGRLGSAGLEGYLYTIDLVSDFGEDRSFEIGDTDGDLGRAAVHNAFANAGGALDLDHDGLVDWAVGQRYHQPGTTDFDGDGVPDGNPADRHATYIPLGAPRMLIQPDPPTRFTLLPISAGREDAFDILIDPDGDGKSQYWQAAWFGGFTCDRDGDGVFEGGDDGHPFASFFIGLFVRDAVWYCCRSDIGPDWTCCTGDGVLNFFDVANFLAAFNAGSPHADYFPLADGDGVLNFFDISTYIAEFNAGCG
jgi:hypothetical protein